MNCSTKNIPVQLGSKTALLPWFSAERQKNPPDKDGGTGREVNDQPQDSCSGQVIKALVSAVQITR